MALFKELADGTIVEYSQEEYDHIALPEIAPTETAVRQERDNRLRNEVDPIASNFLMWEDLTVSKQNEWKQYRQNLLDIPQQTGFPTSVTWPTKPV